MKNLRKSILLLAFISLCISIFCITDVYAKYVSSAHGSVEIAIARWNIKVNTLAITNNTDISAQLTPVLAGNANLAPNVLAPTATGYFDIAIDCSEVDVGFTYTITINNTANATFPDFKVSGYSVNNGTTTTLSAGNPATISDTITYASNTDTRTIRVFITWNDATGATMSDTQDTSFAQSTANITLDVNVAFAQVV